MSILSSLNVTGLSPSVQHDIDGLSLPSWKLWIIGDKSLHAQIHNPSGGSHLDVETNSCPTNNLPHGVAIPYGYWLYKSTLKSHFNTVILQLNFSVKFLIPFSCVLSICPEEDSNPPPFRSCSRVPGRLRALSAPSLAPFPPKGRRALRKFESLRLLRKLFFNYWNHCCLGISSCPEEDSNFHTTEGTSTWN